MPNLSCKARTRWNAYLLAPAAYPGVKPLPRQGLSRVPTVASYSITTSRALPAGPNPCGDENHDSFDGGYFGSTFPPKQCTDIRRQLLGTADPMSPDPKAKSHSSPSALSMVLLPLFCVPALTGVTQAICADDVDDIFRPKLQRTAAGFRAVCPSKVLLLCTSRPRIVAYRHIETSGN